MRKEIGGHFAYLDRFLPVFNRGKSRIPCLLGQRSPDKGYDLCTGAVCIRAELGVARSLGHVFLDSPQNSIGIVSAGCNVSKRICTACGRGFLAAPQEGHDLRTRAVHVRAEGRLAGTDGNAVLNCPQDCVIVVAASGNVGEGHRVGLGLGAARSAPQEGDGLRSGADPVGIEEGVTDTGGDALLHGPVDCFFKVGAVGHIGKGFGVLEGCRNRHVAAGHREGVLAVLLGQLDFLVVIAVNCLERIQHIVLLRCCRQSDGRAGLGSLAARVYSAVAALLHRDRVGGGRAVAAATAAAAAGRGGGALNINRGQLGHNRSFPSLAVPGHVEGDVFLDIGMLLVDNGRVICGILLGGNGDGADVAVVFLRYLTDGEGVGEQVHVLSFMATIVGHAANDVFRGDLGRYGSLRLGVILADQPPLRAVERVSRAEAFVFDYWTKDNGTDSVDPATTMENVPGGTTIIFKANWKSNIVTITFDANGGAWAADVAGYTMNADKTTASKKFNLSDTVEKITPDPVQDGKKFSGWGVKLDENGKPSDKIVAYPLVETSATAAAHKRIFDEKPIIFYAMWEDAAQPTEKLNYTIHQHYIGSNGKQDAQFNDELPKTASAGTKISDLIPAELQKNRKYYYQTYIYLSSETKIVNDNVATPVADDTVLNKDNTQIHLYYYLDAWNDENNTLTGGDNIPDKYQAVVTYKVVGGTWKDGKTDDQVQVFTLKTKNKETGVWEDVTPAPTLGNTIPTGMISSYSRTASQSWDKDITKDTKVTESVTYTYTFTKGSSGGGGGSSSTHYYISLKKVDAQDGEALSGAKFGLYLDGKQIATATSDRNGIVRFSMGSSNYRSLTDKSNLYCQELTAPEGYKLSNEKIAVSKKNVSTSSSTSDKNAKTVKNSRSKTPSMLNGEDHFAYIVGYPDKTVHPQSSITRAEVATIFFRLLTEETRTANATKTNNYADVSSDNWYNQAVSTLSAMGIIKGDSRGNFNPNAPITRAEFAAIAARFDKTEDVAAASFGDVAMHWAKPEISVAANNGWINGYTDGTFHPDSKITRAEAMVMINRVLQRLPESKADLLDGMIQWSDNADTSKWYYLAVQEATNSHYYELKANQHEKWTKLRENRDWTQLEK